MKTYNLVLFLLCIVFAALQYNDPDPYVWIPIYSYTALLALFQYKGHFYRKATLLGIFFYFLFAIYIFLLPDGVIDWYTKYGSENLVQTMKATKPWIEYTREFGGLLFLITALSVNWIAHLRTK